MGNPHEMALAAHKCSISTARGSGAPLGKSLGAEKSFVLLAFTLGTVSQRSVNRHQGPHRLNQSLNLNLLDCSDDQASKMPDGGKLVKGPSKSRLPPNRRLVVSLSEGLVSPRLNRRTYRGRRSHPQGDGLCNDRWTSGSSRALHSLSPHGDLRPDGKL